MFLSPAAARMALEVRSAWTPPEGISSPLSWARSISPTAWITATRF